MRSLLVCLSAAAAAAAIGHTSACTAYDPQLGATPFLCNDTEPKCPSGYECKDNMMGQMVCALAGPGALPDAGSGSQQQFACADDSNLEGGTKNDTVSTAWPSPVASTKTMLVLTNLAICPDGDKDTYRVDVTVNQQNLRATVEYSDPAKGGVALSLSILNAGGTPIANGAPAGGNTVAVTAPNLAMSSSPYYVQVYGPVTGENNYKLTLEVSGP